MTTAFLSDLVQKAKADARSLKSLDDYGLRRTQTGYYYIAHYYPLKAMQPVAADDALGLIEPMAGATFETYLHFPFCEIKCSFCHFYKDLLKRGDVAPQVDLVDAICDELAHYRAILGPIRARSFYIGGGTPSLIDTGLLRRLLGAVRKTLRFEADAELKFELFPQAYEPREIMEKLAVLRDWGTTDLVIDLESGNQESLKRVGRGLSSMGHYRRLLDACDSAGFDSIMTALIIGLPGETFESLKRTLDILCAIPNVKTINTFPLITRQPDPILKQLQRRPERFHSAESRDELWLFARHYLREKGFHEGPISYWSRPGHRPQQQADKFECVNLLGFGPSAFGYLNHPLHAAQYFNVCNRRDYYARVRNGESALWRAGIMGNEERARRKLIFGLANCKAESLTALERQYGVSVDTIVGQELNLLFELGLIEIAGDVGDIRYTAEGLCRLEEVSYFLGSDLVKDAVARRDGPGLDSGEVERHNYYIDVTDADRRAFEAHAALQPRHFMSRFYERHGASSKLRSSCTVAGA